MQEVSKQPQFKWLRVSAAMLANVLVAFGAMFVFPHATSNMRSGAIMAAGAFAVFAVTLFGMRRMVDHCWERLVLVIFGSFFLTMFWIVLMMIVYLVVLYLTGGSIM